MGKCVIDLIWSGSSVRIASNIVYIAEDCYHRLAHQLIQNSFRLVESKFDLIVFAHNVQIVVVETT